MYENWDQNPQVDQNIWIKISPMYFYDNSFLIASDMNLCSALFFTAPGSFRQIMTSGDDQTNIFLIRWYPHPVFTMWHDPIVPTNSCWPFVKIFLQPFLFQMSFFVIRKRWTRRITKFRLANLIGWWINQMKYSFDCFLFRFKVVGSKSWIHGIEDPKSGRSSWK